MVGTCVNVLINRLPSEVNHGKSPTHFPLLLPTTVTLTIECSGEQTDVPHQVASHSGLPDRFHGEAVGAGHIGFTPPISVKGYFIGREWGIGGDPVGLLQVT